MVCAVCRKPVFVLGKNFFSSVCGSEMRDLRGKTRRFVGECQFSTQCAGSLQVRSTPSGAFPTSARMSRGSPGPIAGSSTVIARRSRLRMGSSGLSAG